MGRWADAYAGEETVELPSVAKGVIDMFLASNFPSLDNENKKNLKRGEKSAATAAAVTAAAAAAAALAGDRLDSDDSSDDNEEDGDRIFLSQNQHVLSQPDALRDAGEGTGAFPDNP